jgi:SET domain-containing protein
MPITKKKLLKHLSQQVYCHLAASPVNGVGVFAVRAIPKGVEPLRSLVDEKDISFTHKEIKTLPKSVQQEIKKFCYYDEDHVLIPRIGLNAARMAVYLNHSKSPNVQYQKNGQLKTLRAIKKGEELLMDYDINFEEVHSFE